MQAHALSQGLALLALVVSPVLAAAQTAESPAMGFRNVVSASEPLEELEVVGKKLYQIRMGAVEVEDRFYALYNELNHNDDFDIHCKVEAPTGTLLKARICRLALYKKALVEEARASLTGVDYPPPAQFVALARVTEFEQNALMLVNSNPKLRKLMQQREALERKYWETRKTSFRWARGG